MRKRVLILGAGTAGTTLANTLVRHLDAAEWRVTVVDRDDDHVYQPGLLFVPFTGRERDLVRSRRAQLRPGVELVEGSADRVVAEDHQVFLQDGRTLAYDELVIATGTEPRPDQTPGMTGTEWRRSIFDFNTLDGARALARALDSFDGGRLVVHVAETPIKCPVAPLEFAFLADAYLRRRGIRDRVTLTYVTPLDGAFTRPVAARHPRGCSSRVASSSSRTSWWSTWSRARARVRLHPVPGRVRPGRRRRPADLEGRLGRTLQRRVVRGRLPLPMRMSGKRQAAPAPAPAEPAHRPTLGPGATP